MEEIKYVLYPLYPLYQVEVSMQYSEYPLSRESIEDFYEMQEAGKIGTNLDLYKNSKEIAEILGIQKTPKVLYVDLELKNRYKIVFINFRLSFNFNRQIELTDSERIFTNVFGRTPIADDEFLELNGYEMHPHRKGKSLFSCCVLDKDDNFFVFPYRASTMQHTFITRGDPVKFAGTIKIDNGLITFLDDNSGHYRPHPVSILSVAYFFKKQLSHDVCKIFDSKFQINLVNSSAHPDISFVEKEKIKRNFLKIVELEK